MLLEKVKALWGGLRSGYNLEPYTGCRKRCIAGSVN